MKCPVCGKETKWKNNACRPFCSERCKIIDLAAWATEEYRIEGKSTETEDYESERDENIE